jgi:acetyl-CoA carboxylase carboxyl transferase subunit alpha
MVRLKVPITIIVGEGASGGALGIGWEIVYMLENTWYSDFSRILFFYFMESWEYKEIAAEALKLTSSDMKRQIDDIIPEPLGELTTIENNFTTVEEYIMKV